MKLDEAIRIRMNYFLNQKGCKSLWDLFILSGVPKSTINSLWGSSKNKLPRLNTLLHLCEGLGITLKEFFDDDIFNDVIDTEEDKDQIETHFM